MIVWKRHKPINEVTVISRNRYAGVRVRVMLTVHIQGYAMHFTHSGFHFSQASLSFSLKKVLGFLY